MQRFAVGALLMAGCNQLLGLTETRLQDADRSEGGGGAVDARPVIPPDGTTSCGAVPAFETWSYAARSIPFGQPIGSFGLYMAGGADHMVVTPVDGSGVWDVDLAGSATQIPSLVPPSGKSISSLAVSPDGAAVWFKIAESSYVAFRTTGFARQLTELGLPNAYEVLPASPGFYDGTLRMMARVRETVSAPQTYIELSSTDGATWTRGETQSFGGGNYYAASLSADGCTLLFSSMDSGSTYGLYRASRGSGGLFDTPTKLTMASAVSAYPFNPAISPDLDQLWFTTVSPSQLIEGHP